VCKPCGASRVAPGRSSASLVAACNPLLTTTRRGPNAAPRRHGYRLEAGIIRRLRDERRALIEAAPVELVERDGRVWQLRRLPSAMGE
jgi:hypothetical protein